MHANELFDKVTADLITAIENGASGWQMPWHCLANGTPRSADGQPYRGWNAFVLAMVAADRGWTTGTWGDVQDMGQCTDVQVRRGERGTHIVLWKQTERPDPTDDDTTKRSLLARSFVVFAAEQVDGADRFTTTDERTPAERIRAGRRVLCRRRRRHRPRRIPCVLLPRPRHGSACPTRTSSTAT